jgi:hypothetical protein
MIVIIEFLVLFFLYFLVTRSVYQDLQVLIDHRGSWQSVNLHRSSCAP